MESKCQKCAKSVQPDWLKCPYCGEDLVRQKACSSCGKTVEQEWMNCPYCKAVIEAEKQHDTIHASNFCSCCSSVISGSSSFKCQECSKVTCIKCRVQHPEGLELPLCKTCGSELLKPLWDRKRQEELLIIKKDENEEILRKKYSSILKKGWFGLLDLEPQFYCEVVPLLVKNGVDANKNKKGEIPIIEAATKGNLELVRILVDSGADANIQDSTGDFALGSASGLGFLEIVKALFPHVGNINAKKNNGLNALMLAVYGGYTETVKFLLEKGADVNAKDRYDSCTALMKAASGGRFEIVKLLLEKGADVNAKDIYGRTALMLAAPRGRFEIVKLLLEKGADIKAKDNSGCTALMSAARGGNFETVKLLLTGGAELNAKDNTGDTALHYAVEGGHIEIAKFLMEAGLPLVNIARYGNKIKTLSPARYLGVSILRILRLPISISLCLMAIICHFFEVAGEDINSDHFKPKSEKSALSVYFIVFPIFCLLTALVFKLISGWAFLYATIIFITLPFSCLLKFMGFPSNYWFYFCCSIFLISLSGGAEFKNSVSGGAEFKNSGKIKEWYKLFKNNSPAENFILHPAVSYFLLCIMITGILILSRHGYYFTK